MLMVAESANSDRPPIGFCNDLLLGSKYDGAWKLKTFYDSNVILLFEPGWRSGYRAGLEIRVSRKWAMP